MVDSGRWRRIEELFHAALERAPAERVRFVRKQCGAEADLAGEVEALLAADADATAALRPPAGATLAAALEHEAQDPELGRQVGPWTLLRVLGTGGMGRVYLAGRAGADFEQRAALKLIRRGLATEEFLARFRHERATLARLEHPGIARLLDGGSTEADLPWLAMEYVEGVPLDRWCAEQRLSVPARVALFARVCDAVAHAHGQLVVHRDLKPANILVDAEGTPRLLDFGIAKVLDTEAGAAFTRAGALPFTPAYASPEQVRGEDVGVASDVYALGVILYELLAERRPYRVEATTSAALERAVCEEEPVRPSVAAREAGAARRARALAGDLDNIVGKALAKEPARRYASVAELAQDLRRHLAGLPVTARASTLSYRTSRFVRRHRAASTLALLLALLLAIAFVQYLRALRTDQARLADILRLSDGYRLADLLAELNGPLWPATPDKLAAMDDWLVRAEDLLARRALHEQRLAALAARLASGAQDDDTRWWHAQLERLVADLAAFAADDPFGATVAALRARRASIGRIERRSLVEAAADWERARASIADIAQCPQYGGLELAPQWGLVPLGRNAGSGLWEFADVQTGEPRATGAAAPLVFALLPAGRFHMGAQREEPAAPGYDVHADGEGPVQAVELAAFFMATREMTQGQWRAATGRNPAAYQPPAHLDQKVTPEHPVEQLSWDEASETLRHLGLVLPTEAQWEYACRAGTPTPWWVGDEAAELDAVANLADLDARAHGGSEGWNYTAAEAAGLHDGHTIHAPVGSYAANAFGLFDVHGNVWEWCRDMPAPYGVPVAPGDGARLIPEEIGDLGTRVARGGAFSNPPERARSAARWSAVRGFRSGVLGVRPARVIVP